MAEVAREESSPRQPPAAREESATSNGADSVYPAPEAAYDKVVEDSVLFSETLERLHRRMGTKFMCVGLAILLFSPENREILNFSILSTSVTYLVVFSDETSS